MDCLQQRKVRKADLPVVSSLRPLASTFLPPTGTPVSACGSPLPLRREPSRPSSPIFVPSRDDILAAQEKQRNDSWGSASFCSIGTNSIWSSSGNDSAASSTWSLNSDSTPEEDGYSLMQNYLFHKYERVRDRAIAERVQLGAGNSALMRSMFDFWVCRLKHKFNKIMYQTFKDIAVDDAVHGHYYGVDQLFVFYRASLSSFYRDKVFSDFVDIVSSQCDLPHTGLEQLWIFLRDMPKATRMKCSRSVLPRMYKNSRLVAGLKQLDAFDFDNTNE